MIPMSDAEGTGVNGRGESGPKNIKWREMRIGRREAAHF